MPRFILFTLALIVTFSLFAPVWCYSKNYQGKKALYIDSYHQGYYWSDGELSGAKEILADTGIELKVVHMDTKNNPSEGFKKEAGLKVKKIIEEFEPDVVIAADDNAFKYVIMPYYRDADLPVVFCGINWDISVYDAPYENTTGMIEIGLYETIYKHLKKFSQGNRVGFLGADALSNRKNAEYYNRLIEGGLAWREFVQDFESWKEKYLQLQEKVDMIVVDSPAGIKDWSYEEAKSFVLENIQIPMATEGTPMIDICLIGLAKVSQEQGEYAARCALRILDGEKPSEIPVVTNKKGNLMLNLRIAEKLNVVFEPEMLRNAKIIIGKEY